MSKHILPKKDVLPIKKRKDFLVNEIKVQLEWSMADVMRNYPSLTMAEAEKVLDMFYHDRFIVQREGWSVIKHFANKVLYQKNQNKIQSF